MLRPTGQLSIRSSRTTIVCFSPCNRIRQISHFPVSFDPSRARLLPTTIEPSRRALPFSNYSYIQPHLVSFLFLKVDGSVRVCRFSEVGIRKKKKSRRPFFRRCVRGDFVVNRPRVCKSLNYEDKKKKEEWIDGGKRPTILKKKKKSATIGCGRVEACNPVEQTMRRHHASFRFN